MNCTNVQNSLSDHLDGRLRGQEKLDVSQHLLDCSDCGARLQEMARIQRALKQIPVAAPPAALTSTLRVIASQERSRREVWQQPWRLVAERFHLCVDNMMRPLALPFAGGFVSAMLLFAMLIPSFAVPRNLANDVPIWRFTEPAVKQLDPFILPDEECTVEVLVDGQGRMIDYTIQPGSNIVNNSEFRRMLENKLLFTGFIPATAWGQPTAGKIVISFTREHVNVKS